MTQYLYRLSTLRAPWLLLAASALALELSALYFQYGMQLEPCVLCVYERTAVMGILLGGLIGSTAPRVAPIRWLGFALWIAGAVWGMQLALEHAGVQAGSASCDFLANYPGWFQIDQWIPWLFEPRGLCEEIQWQFFGYSMPQTMIGVYAIYLMVATVVLTGQFYSRR